MQFMGTEKRKASGAIGRVALLSAFWTLIAVTLLSALAPLGPPLSRITGSAFNPATSDVVLKARAPATAQWAQAARPDGDGASPAKASAALWGLFAASIVALWRIGAGGAFPVTRHRRAPVPRGRVPHARAPPPAA